jgi:hypothetical protein
MGYGDRKQVSVRLDVRELAELEREAAEKDVSRSQHIRDTLASRHDDGRETVVLREHMVELLEIAAFGRDDVHADETIRR